MIIAVVVRSRQPEDETLLKKMRAVALGNFLDPRLGNNVLKSSLENRTTSDEFLPGNVLDPRLGNNVLKSSLGNRTTLDEFLPVCTKVIF